jgi:drug/metabolite transporter (DMT)-like permease
MSVLQLGLLLLFISLMSGGQILFKIASSTLSTQGSLQDTLFCILTNPFLISGIFLYGLSTILWVFVLQTMPLSRAYPFVALSMIIVPAMGILVFKEAFSPSLLIGGVLIVCGLLIITLWS